MLKELTSIAGDVMSTSIKMMNELKIEGGNAD